MQVRHIYQIHGFYDKYGMHYEDRLLNMQLRSLCMVGKNWSFDVFSSFYSDVNIGGTSVSMTSPVFAKRDYKNYGKIHYADSDSRYQAFIENDTELDMAYQEMGSWAFVGTPNKQFENFDRSACEEYEELRREAFNNPQSFFPTAVQMGLPYNLFIFNDGKRGRELRLEKGGVYEEEVVGMMNAVDAVIKNKIASGESVDFTKIAFDLIDSSNADAQKADNLRKIARFFRAIPNYRKYLSYYERFELDK